MVRALGRYVVADPGICHGQPTFTGTRILVADVLDQVASGMAWDAIIEDWRGSLTQEAIAEAVRLAREELIANLVDIPFSVAGGGKPAVAPEGKTVAWPLDRPPIM